MPGEPSLGVGGLAEEHVVQCPEEFIVHRSAQSIHHVVEHINGVLRLQHIVDVVRAFHETLLDEFHELFF